ncbi:MAG: hypothetical protein V3V81_08195 [Candidatus Bathyarchaeia archaeon]
MDKRYIAKVRKERSEVLQTSFWAEFVKLIGKARRSASRRCETDEDVKSYQGELRAYDRVLDFPIKIIERLEQTDKR